MANGRAHTGADALVADLNGFDAVRAASGRDSSLSVVAHSYGTNVATIALTKTHADHVVLLGSAGVTDVAPNADALQVPKGEVFCKPRSERRVGDHRAEPVGPPGPDGPVLGRP
ncbi:alpha/beta hydrolase [Curtobacterium flaccumfaciens]|nr:alpha/beta hydrolase [Curtobacterium flaccumfaciens]